MSKKRGPGSSAQQYQPPGIIQAVYAGKSQRMSKYHVLKFEIPLGCEQHILNVLGEYDPETSQWVAIAPITPRIEATPIEKAIERSKMEDEGEPSADEPSADNIVRIETKKAMTRMGRAGMLCKDPNFWQFLSLERGWISKNNDDAAEFVRWACDIESRVELDKIGKPAELWDQVESEYDNWRIKIATATASSQSQGDGSRADPPSNVSEVRRTSEPGQSSVGSYSPVGVGRTIGDRELATTPSDVPPL